MDQKEQQESFHLICTTASIKTMDEQNGPMTLIPHYGYGSDKRDQTKRRTNENPLVLLCFFILF